MVYQRTFWLLSGAALAMLPSKLKRAAGPVPKTKGFSGREGQMSLVRQ